MPLLRIFFIVARTADKNEFPDYETEFVVLYSGVVKFCLASGLRQLTRDTKARFHVAVKLQIKPYATTISEIKCKMHFTCVN